MMIQEARSRDDVLDALPEVAEEHLPTVEMFNTWRNWVRWDLGCDSDGRFIGWCPLHDRFCEAGEDNPDNGAAGFNFATGSFDCMHDPSCHAPKRGMTLVSLFMHCARRYLDA